MRGNTETSSTLWKNTPGDQKTKKMFSYPLKRQLNKLAVVHFKLVSDLHVVEVLLFRSSADTSYQD